MPTVYTEVEVDVSLSDFSDDELLDEIEMRGLETESPNTELVNQIYQKRRLGKDYQAELEELIYNITGKFL
jgi:hypothetical protein